MEFSDHDAPAQPSACNQHTMRHEGRSSSAVTITTVTLELAAEAAASLSACSCAKDVKCQWASPGHEAKTPLDHHPLA